jgi:ABC-type antimicrobial peptide transport system permease subunit
MYMLANDLRYAFRRLRRSPGFAAAAVFTLALGIGASSAIFCLIDGLWLHPMRVPHAGEQVRIFATTQQTPAAEEGVDTYFNFTEYQTISMASASGVLAFAIVLAAWLPARRAASIDPMQALRNE